MTLLTFILAILAALSTPCAQEDDYACYWDASTRGNGIGQSFVVGPEHNGHPVWIIYFAPEMNR